MAKSKKANHSMSQRPAGDAEIDPNEEGYGPGYFSRRFREELVRRRSLCRTRVSSSAENGEISKQFKEPSLADVMTFDMTNTSFADATERAPLPTEGELMAVMVALVLTNWCMSPENAERILVFSDENFAAVARIFDGRLASLVPEFGQPCDFHATLRKFVGLKIRIGGECDPIFH